MITKQGIIQRVGNNLALLKKRANVSFEKIALATDISLSHVRNACSGEANISILYLEKFAAFFGIDEAFLLKENPEFPQQEILQKNIEKYLMSKGFTTTYNFRVLGPTYIVEDYISKESAFPEPLYASQIKDSVNEENQVNYKTNDISRALNNFVRQGLISMINTGNPKRPKYDKAIK